jgi:flagellar biosynthesis/type III secretory pathway chaperone
MQPDTCREHLQNLLADEAALLLQLEKQLGQEHELLMKNDVDGLDAAGDARQATVASLLRVEDDRRSLCRMLGRSSDVAGIADLLSWCDPAGSLRAAQAQVTERATHCRTQNDRNGALVSARLNRVSGMLQALDPSPASAGTYAAGGARSGDTHNHAGRLLATQA